MALMKAKPVARGSCQALLGLYMESWLGEKGTKTYRARRVSGNKSEGMDVSAKTCASTRVKKVSGVK